MADRRVEDYAYRHNVSHKEAKRRLGRKRAEGSEFERVARGVPIAGTGKPKGE